MDPYQAVNSPLIHRIAGRPVQNGEMQGGRILRKEAYIQYAATTQIAFFTGLLSRQVSMEWGRPRRRH